MTPWVLHSDAFLWLILDIALKSAALLLVAHAVDRLFLRRRPLAADVLWTSMMIVLVSLPLACSVLPHVAAPHVWTSRHHLEASDRASAGMLPGGNDDGSHRTLQPPPFDVAAQPVGAAPARQAESSRAWGTLWESVQAISRTAGWTLPALYCCVASLIALRIGSGLLAVSRLRRAARTVLTDAWMKRLWEDQSRLGIRRPVLLMHSANVVVPLTVGWIRPMVIIPSSAVDDADTDQVKVILLHELVHIARCDYPLHVLSKVVQCLHWYNPLVWMAVRRLVRVRETVCDGYCVSSLEDRDLYLRVLLTFARTLTARPHPTLGLAFARTSHLERRIREMDAFTVKHHSPSRSVRITSFGTAFTAAVAIGIVALGQGIDSEQGQGGPTVAGNRGDSNRDRRQLQGSGDPKDARVTHDTSGPTLEHKLGEADADRLRTLWAGQVQLVKTARIRARYLLCSSQKVSREQMQAFLDELTPVVRHDADIETVELLIREACPAKRQVWRDAVLTLDGKKFRERLDELEPRPEGYTNFQETTFDGEHEAMYWRNSEQVTISAKRGQWSHLGLRDFWTVPRGQILQHGSLEPLDDEKARIKFGGKDGYSGFVVFEQASGLLLQSGSVRGNRFSNDRYQCDFREFNGVPFPRVTFDIQYRDGMLYRFAVLMVHNAHFNQPLDDKFQLSVPKRTVIVDRRLGDKDVETNRSNRVHQVTEPITDVVRWLVDHAALHPPVVRLELPVASERESAAAIRKLGGWYDLDDSGHVVAVNMVSHRSDNYSFYNKMIDTDAALPHVATFPRLKRLYLKEGQATDASLEYVAGLSQLETFSVWDAHDVSDVGAEHLGGLKNLRHIHIGSGKLTDKSLETFSRLPKIEKLSLQGNAFTDAGLEHLSNVKQLRSLSVGSPKNNMTDAGARHLAGLTELEKLRVTHARLSDEGVRHLRNLKRLKDLSVSGDITVGKPSITDASIEVLEGMQFLENLDILNSQITDAGIPRILELPNLQFARVGSKQLSAEMIIKTRKEHKHRIWLTTGYLSTDPF